MKTYQFFTELRNRNVRSVETCKYKNLYPKGKYFLNLLLFVSCSGRLLIKLNQESFLLSKVKLLASDPDN